MKNLLRKINFTLVFALGLIGILRAQTTVLVDPNGAGGFELGATLAENGWSQVGGTADNWTVGSTAALTPATGTNCGFVSSNGGTTWAYSQVSTFIQLFRDITIPAGQSKLTIAFKWRANGEGTTTSDWDNLKVYLAPSSYTPAVGVSAPAANQIAGPGAISGMYKLSSANWNNESITISAIPGTTYRLVFQWKSDISDIVNPPAALDDISVQTTVPGDFISITSGDWNNPLTWDANAVPSGADNAIVSTGHTVTVNAIGQAINNISVNGTLAYAAAPTQFNVNGNLTVSNTGLVNVFQGTTGKTLVVTGNITNNGRIDISVGTGAAGNLTLNGTVVQTISGSGAFGGINATTTTSNTVGVIRNLVCSNTSTATPNIVWSIPSTIRIANNLNLTGARVNASGNTFVFGNYAAGGTLTSPVGTGFLSGTKFSRWWTTTAGGTTITAGAEPAAVAGMYPFLSATGQNRRLFIRRSSTTATGNTAGELAVVYQNSTVLTQNQTIADGAYIVTDRFEANWSVTAEAGYVYVSGTHEVALVGTGGFFPTNGNSRIILQNATVGGTHQNGTTLPVAQRIGLSTAQLTAGALYMGINTIDNQYPCDGTPTAGNTQASVSLACSGTNFTLSLQGNVIVPGLGYQWQISTDGNDWTNIAGATNATLITNQTSPRFYRCLITCTALSLSSNSTPLLLNMDVPTNCYCTPVYTSGISSGDLISNVQIVGTTLNNNSGTSTTGPSYTFFSGQPNHTADLLPSTNYQVNISVGTWGNQHIRAWIDYNDNGFFEASEVIGQAIIAQGQGNTGPFPPASFTISLACTPPAGIHRMRIRSVWSTGTTQFQSIDPCASYGFGETEDYLINIVAPPSCPSTGTLSTVSTASFTADLNFNLGCATATTFDFEYGPVGFTSGTGTLVSNQTVTINGTTASYTLSGLQPLTAYEVRVRANCGNGDVSSWSNATPVTTLDPPCAGAPDAPSASLNGITAICAGQTITVSAGGFTTGVLGISNIWETSTNNIDWTPIAGAIGPIYTSGPLSAGTVYFRISSTCTNSNITTNSNVLTLTVNALPVVTVSVPNNGVICGTQTLTASGAESYSWSPSNVLSANTGSAVVYTGSTSQTVIVVGTDVNGCVSLPTPQVVSFTTPDAINSTISVPSFCATGGASSISVSSTAPYTYTFQSLGTGVITAQTSNSFDVTVTETSNFRITGTDATTNCMAMTVVTISVFPLPTSNITSSAQGVCPGTSATINTGLTAQGFTSNPIPFAALSAPVDAVTLVTGGVATPPTNLGFGLDDAGWSAIPIGFGFNFFGTIYNTVSIGTNGTVFMGNTGNVGDFTFTTLPSTTEPFNMIAVLAMDNNPNATNGGTIQYWTEGTTPNRKFVVNYDDIKEFGDERFSSAQAIFYETTGIVEVHVEYSTNIDRNKLVGINNGDGTQGVLAYSSGTVASATNPITNPFAYRFSPPANFTVEWSTVDAQGNLTQIATGTNLFSLDVTPTATTTYDISYTNQTTGCTNALGSSQITINVLGDVAPSGLSTASSDTLVCSGINFTLSTGYTGSTEGLTFQWQSSSNGVDFSNIAGATSATLNISQTANTFYRLSVVSCGGTPSISTPLEVTVDIPTNCYCTPVYTSGTSVGDLISNVEIVGTTLSNNTGTVQGGPSYTFFTGQPNFTANLLPSTTYQVNVSVGTWGDQHIRAWIDYNDDGIFSSSEIIGQSVIALNQGNTGPFPPASFSIALACNPPAGPHRMRIRSVWSTNATFFETIDPCASYGFGETEDYIVTILPAPTCPSISTPILTGSTTNTASLLWPMGCSTATNFDIEYGATGFTPGTGTLLSDVVGVPSGVNMTYVVTGLTPNSSYQFYVRANCGNGDVSAWTLPVNASTPCAPVDVADISDVITCDSYTLPAIAEVTPSNNNGLVLGYFTQPNGGGTQLTGNITTSQTIYIRGVAGACSDQEVFTVTINNSTSSTATEVACSSFDWNGTTYTTSGVYTFNTVNAVGCDSVATLNLTINQPTTATLNVNACQSFTINNQTYTTSGTYIQNLTNVAGCDSTLTINVNIGEPDATSVTETACDSYSWNGMTYTTSGVYTETLQNIFGCDSVVTLNLTINNSTTSSTSISTCDSYTWNGTTYTASGTYTFVTTNTAGCDSTATLILTIGNNGSTTSATTCGSFTWTNNQTYTASGIYNQTLVNAAGCDSVVTLNLTILPLPTATATDNGAGTLTSSAGASYQWINCATNAPIAGATSQTFSPEQNGSYAVTVTNSNGCSATSTCVVVDYIGLDELSRMALNVYPNPTTGEINIAVDGVTESYNVTVEDMNGRLVMNLGALINTNGTYQVNMTNLITGVYFIKLNSNGNERVVRVIKQ